MLSCASASIAAKSWRASAINRLDRFDRLILDDFAYVSKDQAETSVLFEVISARYEHRSLCVTANQPFGEWDKVFPDRATTVAAVDRPVHHSTIFELNVESYRRRTAPERKQQGPGRPVSIATPKNVGMPPQQDDLKSRPIRSGRPSRVTASTLPIEARFSS